VQFYRSTVQTKENYTTWQAPRYFDLCFDFCQLKMCINGMLCHSNESVNYLYHMCFMHANDHEINHLHSTCISLISNSIVNVCRKKIFYSNNYIAATRLNCGIDSGR
jgi:hypothetical protein